MVARDIILDCDPGQDDAVAILLALAHPERLNVLGVTAVAGNVPLELTYANARKVVELAGRADTPVYAGCPRPLCGALVTAEDVHGLTGLDGVDLPDPSLPESDVHAVDFIVDTLRAAGDAAVTVCAVGPLTNIASAIVKAPDILPRIGELVIMGGAYWEGGNTSPMAEFNIYVDPEAAAAVFGCGRPITVMSLDVTHKALSTAARRRAIRDIGGRVSQQVHNMLSFYNRYDETKYGFDGGPLHDPCTIAYLLQPELFKGKRVNAEVELGGPLTRGATVVDWWGVTGRDENVTWINEIDDDGFYALINDALRRLDHG